MSKRNEKEKAMTNLPLEEAAAPASELTHTALGNFQDENGVWNIVEILFNPLTKETQFAKVSPQGTHKSEAHYRFKVMAAQKGLVG